MESTIEFYDVSKREKVSIPISDVKKTTYERVTRNGINMARYAVKAERDGSKLTKFVTKDFWDGLDVGVI